MWHLPTICQKNVANGCPKTVAKTKTVPVPYTEAQLMGMFRRFDANGDGQLPTICQKNVANGCPKTVAKTKTVPVPYTEAQLMGMFRRFDANGDGQLSRQELRNAFCSLGSSAPGWRAFRALCHADRNGDGYISEPELENLVRYALKHGYTVN